MLVSGFTWPRAKGRDHSQYTDETEVGHPRHTVLREEKESEMTLHYILYFMLFQPTSPEQTEDAINIFKTFPF